MGRRDGGRGRERAGEREGGGERERERGREGRGERARERERERGGRELVHAFGYIGLVDEVSWPEIYDLVFFLEVIYILFMHIDVHAYR